MKNDKLIKAFFAPRSIGTTSQVVGLIAGLVTGVVLGVLFAPDSGESVRKRIIGAAKGLIDFSEAAEEELATESGSQDQTHKKKPKSDIKALVHKAHVAAHPEQEVV